MLVKKSGIDNDTYVIYNTYTYKYEEGKIMINRKGTDRIKRTIGALYLAGLVLFTAGTVKTVSVLSDDFDASLPAKSKYETDTNILTSASCYVFKAQQEKDLQARLSSGEISGKEYEKEYVKLSDEEYLLDNMDKYLPEEELTFVQTYINPRYEEALDEYYDKCKNEIFELLGSVGMIAAGSWLSCKAVDREYKRSTEKKKEKQPKNSKSDKFSSENNSVEPNFDSYFENDNSSEM